jgi:epoxyqueuosine reductase QueG
MNTSSEIKKFAITSGAEKCGIASIERFNQAPSGFQPKDILPDCKSVVVFLIQMPTEIIKATNPIPYTNTAYLLYGQLDRIGLELCKFIQKNGDHAVPVPADVPYISWDSENMHGQGILSLRHAGYFAGLGILGRNTLLINPELGNMVYIGAVLTDVELEPDPIETKFKCPPKCRICLDICPQKALNGTTVNQKLCRQISFYKHERGFDIYDCNACRKSCILITGRKQKTNIL